MKIAERITCFDTNWSNKALEMVKITSSIPLVFRNIIETDWNMKEIDLGQIFQSFRNVSKQNWNKI